MNSYEKLLNKVSSELPVIEDQIKDLTGYTALYRNNRIYLELNLNLRDKRVQLAEEYGHHKRTVGNILDYNAPGAWKEEWKARRYAVDMLITLDDLLDCALHGFNDKYQCSEYLDVTPDFFEDALLHYYNKFGVTHYYRNYKFIFSKESVQIEKILDYG